MPEIEVKSLFQVFPVGSLTISAVYSRQVLSFLCSWQLFVSLYHLNS